VAYQIPRMPITCDIFTPDVPGVAAIPTSPARLAGVRCNLAWGKRTNAATTGGTVSVGVLTSAVDLLLPARTDIRGPQDTTSFDMVCVPSGSGRWYQVTAVDDVGKGFANEYRIAVLLALANSWVPPYP
jgi:hypothetical protein